MANAGVNVVGLARRVEKLEELKKELDGARGKVSIFCCDVSDVKSVENAFADIESNLGGTNLLVNNAGRAKCIKIFANTLGIENDLSQVVETNLMGTIWCAREAFKSMTKRSVHGHIVIMSSVIGHSVPFSGGDVPSHT